MSEQEQEQEQEQEAEESPEQPLAPDEVEAEEEAEAAEQEKAEQAEQAEQPESLEKLQKRIDKLYARIDGRAETFRNAVAETFGEMAQAFHVCPLCQDHIPGFLRHSGPTQEAIDRTRAAMGMPDLSNYQPAKNARKCPDCEGLGVVLSGSLVTGNVAIDCDTCHASGYVVTVTGTGELVAPPQANGTTPPALPAGVNEDDPAIRSLRARGYSIFPPPPVLTGPTAQ